MSKYIRKDEAREAVLYTGDIKDIETVGFIKERIDAGYLKLVCDISGEPTGALVYNSTETGTRVIPSNVYIIKDEFNSLYKDIYWKDKEVFEKEHELIQKGNENSLSVNLKLDTKEFEEKLKLLEAHFSIVSQGIKDIDPMLKINLEDKIKVEFETELDNRDVNVKVNVDIEEVKKHLAELRRELNDYNEKRIGSLRVITKDQFILEHLERNKLNLTEKGLDKIKQSWYSLSKGYGFALKASNYTYSVEHLKNILMNCDSCKHIKYNGCDVCKYEEVLENTKKEVKRCSSSDAYSGSKESFK